MAPPRARDFVLGHLGGFDDEALETFLEPGDWGVDPPQLGTALQGGEHDRLAARVLGALPEPARAVAAVARSTPADPEAIDSARRHVVDRLFWALLYWHDPAGYEELVAGEHIHPGILEALPIRDAVVADLGAGAGRFTLFAAQHARQVIAVDAVPALLVRLEEHARRCGLRTIETRRGGFRAIPIEDGAVDVAVACSSLTSHAPWGGPDALAEACRIVRPGGMIAVIWPDDPAWFTAQGFVYTAMAGNDWMEFADVATAERICRSFYSDQAAEWVVSHQLARVPFAVLGTPPPSDACLAVVDEQHRPDPGPSVADGRPQPGIEVAVEGTPPGL